MELANNLDQEANISGKKQYTEDFFSDEGLARYEFLKQFFQKNLEKKTIDEYFIDNFNIDLNYCEGIIKNRRELFSKRLTNKQQEIYQHAVSSAQNGKKEDVGKFLDEFVNMSVKYSVILDENNDTINDVIKEVNQTCENYIIQSSGSKNILDAVVSAQDNNRE